MSNSCRLARQPSSCRDAAVPRLLRSTTSSRPRKTARTLGFAGSSLRWMHDSDRETHRRTTDTLTVHVHRDLWALLLKQVDLCCGRTQRSGVLRHASRSSFVSHRFISSCSDLTPLANCRSSYASTTVTGSGNRITLQGPSGRRSLDGKVALELFFGAGPAAVPGLPCAERRVLAGVLPWPLYVWGFDSI